jgi:hypothetical protein
MKVTVIVDEAGKVVATAPQSAEDDGPVHRLVPGKGQSVHELELPAELEGMASADAFHDALGEHLSRLT